MRSMTALSTAAAAAALLAAPAPALAVATASGTLSDISFTLIDLNPGDGIDPAVTWGAPSQSVQATIGANTDWSWSGVMTDALSAAVSDASRTAWAETDGNGVGSVGASSQAYSNSSTFGYTNLHQATFELTPWTALVMHGHFSGSAETTVGYDGTNWESAYAYAYLQLDVWVDGGWEGHYAARQAYAGALWTEENGYSGMTGSFDGAFSVAFANLADVSANGYAYATAWAQANGLAPAVPEPGTWALMLAGLAGVGSFARRRAAAR